MMQPFKLIFGSTAIKYWFHDYTRIPNDLDYIVSHIPQNKSIRLNATMKKIEYFKNGATDYILKINKDEFYVDPDLLYTIKCSHLAWDLKNKKWWRHLKDAVFLKNKGCKLNKEVFDMLYKEWEVLHGSKSHISLNKATEMFFKDGVRREYDHDWLHVYFSITGTPAYESILVSPDTPLCSEVKFNEISDDRKMHTALEEMYIVSFERGISLPNAYKNLVTKMTKGWWNLYLIENAEMLLNETEHTEQYKIKVNKLKESYNGTK